MHSQISADLRVSTLVGELARMARAAPNLTTLDRLSGAACTALDALATTAERGGDFRREARVVYALGLVLALALPRALPGSRRMLRFRATAERILDLAEAYVPEGDRAMRRALVDEKGDPWLPGVITTATLLS